MGKMSSLNTAAGDERTMTAKGKGLGDLWGVCRDARDTP